MDLLGTISYRIMKSRIDLAKKNNKVPKILGQLFFLLFLPSMTLFGQSGKKTITVTTVDDIKLVGTIIEESDNEILFALKSIKDTITLRKSMVKDHPDIVRKSESYSERGSELYKDSIITLITHDDLYFEGYILKNNEEEMLFYIQSINDTVSINKKLIKKLIVNQSKGDKFNSIKVMSNTGNEIHQTIIHKNGSIYKGSILTENDSIVKFKLSATSDTIHFNKNNISSIKRIEKTKSENSTNESMGFTPTAFNLKKGEKRYRNVLLYYNDYSQGLSDNLSFTLGLMLPVDILFGDLFFTPAIRIKYTHSITNNLHIGLAPTFIYDPYEGSLISMAAGSLTYGQPNKFLNFGYNFTYQGNFGDLYNVISIGGGIALNDGFAIGTDNSIVFTDGNITPTLSFMGKYRIGKNHQIHLGVYTIVESYSDIIPIIGYTKYW